MTKTSHKQSAQVAPTSVGVEGSGQKIAEAAEVTSEKPAKAITARAIQDQSTVMSEEASCAIREYAAKQVKKGALDESMLEKISYAAQLTESARDEVDQWIELATQTLTQMSSDQSDQERWLRVTENGDALEYRLVQELGYSEKRGIDEKAKQKIKWIIGTRFIAGGFELLCDDDEHRRKVIAALDKLQLYYRLESYIDYWLESESWLRNCTLTLSELREAMDKYFLCWEVIPALENIIFRAIAKDHGIDIPYGKMIKVDPTPEPLLGIFKEDEEALKSAKEHIAELEFLLHERGIHRLPEAVKTDLGKALSQLNTSAAVMAGIKVTVD